MNNRNMIINVLRNIASDKRMLNHADYWALICGEAADLLESDAIALQKAQEPRVMTQEEVWSLPEGSVAWFEERDDGGRTYIQPMMSNGNAFMIGMHLDINVSRGSSNWSNRRFWTTHPTDEQREEVKWGDGMEV